MKHVMILRSQGLVQHSKQDSLIENILANQLLTKRTPSSSTANVTWGRSKTDGFTKIKQKNRKGPTICLPLRSGRTFCDRRFQENGKRL